MIRGNRFESPATCRSNSNAEDKFRDGQSVKLVFRPEDVFLRRPENLTQQYQRLTEGVVEEISFVGAFERVGVRINFSGRPDR